MIVASKDLVRQHPDGVGYYSFGESESFSVQRVRPKQIQECELQVVATTPTDLRVSGGIDGARYRITKWAGQESYWFDVRVTSEVPVESVADSAVVVPDSSFLLGLYEKKLQVFRFSLRLKSFKVFVHPIKSVGNALLTYDCEELAGDRKHVALRLIASTATAGDRYRVVVVGSTDEMISQDISISVDVQIKG